MNSSFHYQTVIDLREAGKFCGSEALVRWRHRERAALFLRTSSSRLRKKAA